MTFTGDAEIAQFDAICKDLEYSRSDTLRLAVNMAFKLGWTVPLWRKPTDSTFIAPVEKPAQNGRKRGRKKKS